MGSKALFKRRGVWYTKKQNDRCGGVKGTTGMETILHEVLVEVVNLAIIIFEFMGVAVIIVAGLQGIFNYVRRDPMTRLKLAKGMAMGLEFKLGSEILRTVVVRELSEIAIVGAIILLRAALTFLIHWEIKNEEAQVEQELEEKRAEMDRADEKQPGA